MCFGSKPAAAQPLPPTPPAAPTMADPAVQQSRNDAQSQARREGGLSSTQLTVNLGGQGEGNKKLAGTQ
jgi:hypothetical protein